MSLEPIETNYRPTVLQVATFIRSRTVNRFNKEQGTFNSETIPDNEQVDEQIVSALSELSSIFGSAIPDAPAPHQADLYRITATNLVANLAAAKVELAYFAKEVARENSPYNELMEQFNRSLLWLADKLGISVPGMETEDGSNMGTGIAIWGNAVGDPFVNMQTRPL